MKDELGTFIDLPSRRHGLPDGSYAATIRLDPCGYCGRPADPWLPATHPNAMTVDHIIPVSQGGEKGISLNTVAACRDCNGRRKALPLLKWLLRVKANAEAEERARSNRLSRGYFTAEQIEALKDAFGP